MHLETKVFVEYENAENKDLEVVQLDQKKLSQNQKGSADEASVFAGKYSSRN